MNLSEGRPEVAVVLHKRPSQISGAYLSQAISLAFLCTRQLLSRKCATRPNLEPTLALSLRLKT